MKKITKKAFTLVEIMVALTIFWVIMISVMGVYIVSSETTYSSDINRAMQENVKNIVMEISEDIMKTWIRWVEWQLTVDVCTNLDTLVPNDPISPNKFLNKNIFCSWDYLYFLWKKSWNDFVPESNCDEKTSECLLVRAKIWNLSEKSPITNSLVTVRSANFLVTNNWTKKVTISLKIQASSKAGVRISTLENSILNFQTTLSERHAKKYK